MEKALFFNVIVAIAASVTSLAGGQLPDVQGVTRDNTVTIAMVGDILLHTPVEEAAALADGGYDFKFIFDKTRDDISAADIAIVNQEVIIGGEELGVSGYPAFNAPYAIGDALVDAGFDVVCHATNHALDKGGKGVKNALDYWNTNHPQIEVLGIHDSADDQNQVSVYEKNGIKVAILNYTYGTNGIKVPGNMPYAVDLLDRDKVVKDLEYAETNADFTVVCPHWGIEYNHQTSQDERKWLDVFTEHGADLVIGTHPHVIEPIEMKDGVLVYYSLGNFVNWTSGTGAGVADRMVGGMAQVTITKDDAGNTTISDYGVEALVCHLNEGKKGVVVYPLSEYTDELGRENEIRKQDSSFTREYAVELCDKVWGNLWR